MSLRKEILKTSARKKRRRIFLKVAALALGLFFLSGFAVAIFFIPSLRINSIIVEGLAGAQARELREEINELLSKKYFYLFPKNNFLLFPEKEVEALLANKFRIKNFELKKDFPSELRISITERESWAVWCSFSCLFIDKEGFAFVSAPSLSGGAILKINDERDEDFLGRNILPPEEFQKLVEFVERLPRRIDEEVTSIEIKASGNIRHLNLKSGWYLIIDDETDVEKALENLTLALNSEIKDSRSRLEYIDLRFSDKVFYRFKE